MTAKSANWGGKRPGSGRPAGTDKKFRGFRLNNDEFVAVKEFIKKLRQESVNEKICKV